jgi:hypothetical protein
MIPVGANIPRLFFCCRVILPRTPPFQRYRCIALGWRLAPCSAAHRYTPCPSPRLGCRSPLRPCSPPRTSYPMLHSSPEPSFSSSRKKRRRQQPGFFFVACPSDSSSTRSGAAVVAVLSQVPSLLFKVRNEFSPQSSSVPLHLIVRACLGAKYLNTKVFKYQSIWMPWYNYGISCYFLHQSTNAYLEIKYSKS